LVAVAAVVLGPLCSTKMWGIDGHFHLAYARWIAQQHTITEFPWMAFSIFEEIGWVDHQLLFHLAQVPFSMLGVVDGAHASAAAFAAIAVVAFWAYLRHLGLRAAGLWTLALLCCSAPFVFRLLLPRPTALSIALLLACLGSVAAGRSRWAGGLAFVYAWTYHVSLIALPLALLLAVIARLHGERGPLRAAAALGAGLVLGFAINPYSPATFEFLYLHVIYKVLNPDNLPVGQEWLATSPQRFLRENHVVLALWGLAGGAALWTRTKLRPATVAHLLIAGLWLWAATRSYKFIEYLVPFALISAALLLRDVAEQRQAGGRSERWLAVAGSRPARIATLVLLGTLALATAWNNAQRLETRRPDPERYRPAMEALCSNAEPGTLVVHTRWSQFAELMAWCSDLRYVVGLDPSFMYLSHPEEFELLERAERGELADLSSELLEPLGGQWLFVSAEQPLLYAGAVADDNLSLVYQDPVATLFGVVAR
jgi:hypothetical protein